MFPLPPPIVFCETSNSGVRYLSGAPSLASAFPTELSGPNHEIEYSDFVRLEKAIRKQHKRTVRAVPAISTLGNPPRGDFPMPRTIEEAKAHLYACRELNDMAILGLSRGQNPMLELHLAGKHRDAASNFMHHSGSYEGSAGFYTLESFVVNHNQIRGLLEARSYDFASSLLDIHFGNWLYFAGMPMERFDEVEFVGEAIQYLNTYLNTAR